MTDYQHVIDTLREHDLSWKDIDRIELHENTYQEFTDRASFHTSNYATSDAPAVRTTAKDEQIVYTDSAGEIISLLIND